MWTSSKREERVRVLYCPMVARQRVEIRLRGILDFWFLARGAIGNSQRDSSVITQPFEARAVQSLVRHGPKTMDFLDILARMPAMHAVPSEDQSTRP